MIKKIQILFFVLIYSGFAIGQQNNSYYPNKIMLKLNSLHRELSTTLGINNSDFQSVLNSLTDVSLTKKFPNHIPPLDAINQFGDSLIDLSLWYELNYKSEKPILKIINDIKKIGIFKYVERRGINHVFYTPSDPKIGNQYYLNNIKAYQAWDIETGDTNVVVAITDTGIDKLQEDLIDGIKYNYNDTIDGIDNDNDGFIDNFCGWDMANNDNNSQWGVAGHGTFVSGFVSAVPDNNIGIAGVGYHTKVLPIRVDDSTGYLSADYEGIVYSADHGAQIINCSWGGRHGENFGRDVVNYATNNRGSLVVAACGNSNNSVWFFPASYKNVLSCAATDSVDVRWSNSSYGTNVDLCAPGTYVYSTWVSNAYISSHGTSFSAPIIAGGAALVKAHFPNFTNLQITEQLRVTSDNIDTISANSSTIGMMGAGRMNIYRALTDTLKPSIRIKNELMRISQDTLFITGNFINYLCESSQDLYAFATTNSAYLSPIDTSFNIGVLNTFATANNNSHAFRFKISSNIPIGKYADIKLVYTDTNYFGFEYLRIYLNNEKAILDTNNITTSVNSHSTIGFANFSRERGSGFKFNNGRNLLSWGGLLIATAGNKVSDNTFESDFIPLSFAMKLPATTQADQKWLNIFNDNGAGASKNSVYVEQYSYAKAQAPLDDIIFLEYHIVNKGYNNLGNLHIGFYADWDIGLSYANKAEYDSLKNLAYTYPAVGGTYAAIQLMIDSTSHCYNFDNNGKNGSIKIYDGFLDFEKWDAMNQNRYKAGYALAQGSDVSSLLSVGPFSLFVGDTLKITFALLAGNNEYEIKQTAQAAKDWFFNTASINKKQSISNNKLFQNAPNPVGDFTSISFKLEKSDFAKLQIFNIQGQLIETVVSAKLKSGIHSYKINIHNYKSGIYVYRLSTASEEINRRMIVK